MPADTKQKGTLISKSVTVDTIHSEYSGTSPKGLSKLRTQYKKPPY